MTQPGTTYVATIYENEHGPSTILEAVAPGDLARMVAARCELPSDGPLPAPVGMLVQATDGAVAVVQDGRPLYHQEEAEFVAHFDHYCEKADIGYATAYRFED
jgi:hypothetical protein